VTKNEKNNYIHGFDCFIFDFIQWQKSTKRKRKNKIITVAMTDSANFKSGYSDVNGLKMYYEMHGYKGDFLVLIHGGGSNISTSFGKILPMLAKDYKVIAVELQAHGHTNDRNSPESFEQDADDVAVLLHNLQISKASFLGFSNGGNTTMQIANRHPEIVNKLILASTFYKREGLIPGFFDGMKHATIEVMPQPLKDAFLQVNPDSSKLLTIFNKDKERMLHFTDWKDEIISSIKAPTLIINGDQDVIVSSHAVAMSKLISNSRLMILPATHGSYMGVAESPNTDSKMIEMTADLLILGFFSPLVSSQLGETDFVRIPPELIHANVTCTPKKRSKDNFHLD
jgi:pimeloyl-ACP methyl ester carboxylesterase